MKLVIAIIVLMFIASCGVEKEPSDPTSTKMYLTVPAMERVDRLPVYSGGRDKYEEYLKRSALHVKQTGYPWDSGNNVYIAGHRIGYPGTKSNKVFADIEKVDKGDKIYLEDANGREYVYRVFLRKVVSPQSVEALEPYGNKDTITIQSCTLPDYKERVLYVGERIE